MTSTTSQIHKPTEGWNDCPQNMITKATKSTSITQSSRSGRRRVTRVGYDLSGGIPRVNTNTLPNDNETKAISIHGLNVIKDDIYKNQSLSGSWVLVPDLVPKNNYEKFGDLNLNELFAYPTKLPGKDFQVYKLKLTEISKTLSITDLKIFNDTVKKTKIILESKNIQNISEVILDISNHIKRSDKLSDWCFYLSEIIQNIKI